MHVEFQRYGGLSPALMNRAPRYVADLTPHDAAQVRALVPVDFYVLKTPLARRPAPDAFHYDIVVQDGEQRNAITLGEDEIPPSLQPLLEWLEHRAEA